MKKSEITFIRLMSLIGIMSLNLILLLVFSGEHVFQNILNRMNSNVYAGASLDTSIYNYYYYAGLGSIYKIIFPVTILLLAVAVVAVYKKVSMAGRVSLAANICSLVTGVYLLFARIGEGIEGIIRWVNSFYMDKSEIGQVEKVQLMSKVPVVYVLIIILSLLGLAMVKSSTINRIKVYNDKSAVNNAVVYVFPALGGFLVLEIVRNFVISRLVTISADETLGTVAAYVNDYYIGSRLFFNWSWLIIFTIVTCAAILLRPVNKINVKSKIVLEVAVFSVVVSVVSLIYWMNPPALFGYLTTDNTICDMTEEAFAWYLIRYVVTLVLVFVLIALTVNDKLDIRITGIVMAAAFIAGLVFIIIAYNVKGMLSFMYAACVLADVIGAVVLVALLVAGTFNVKEDK
mgnify:FL=1